MDNDNVRYSGEFVTRLQAELTACRSRLELAERDSKRMAILNAAIEDARLFVDGNSLPPVSAYPPDDNEAYVVYDLTDAADELIAHAEKLAATTKGDDNA